MGADSTQKRFLQVVLFPPEAVEFREIASRGSKVTNDGFLRGVNTTVGSPAFPSGSVSNGNFGFFVLKSGWSQHSDIEGSKWKYRNADPRYSAHIMARQTSDWLTAIPTFHQVGKVFGLHFIRASIQGKAQGICISIPWEELPDSPRNSGEENLYPSLCRRANMWLKRSKFKDTHTAAYVVPPIPGLDNLYFSIGNPQLGDKVLAHNQAAGEVDMQDWNPKNNFLQWRFDYPEAGIVQLINRATRQALAGDPRGKIPVKTVSPSSIFGKWKPELMDDGQWRFILLANPNKYLDRGDADRCHLVGKNDLSKTQRFSPQVIRENWKVELEDFIVSQEALPTEGERKIDLITSQVWFNDSPAAIEETIQYSKTETKTFEFGLSQTLTVSQTFAMEAEIPLIGTAKNEISFEVSLAADQRWSNAVEETYSIEKKISLGERAAIEIHGFVDWVDDHRVPFTMKMWVSAKAVTVKDGVERSMSAEEIEQNLFSEGFTGSVIRREPDRILVGLDGTMVGSFGLKTIVKIKEIDLGKLPGNSKPIPMSEVEKAVKK